MTTKSLASQIVSVAAPAKINLYFDILNKRADDYHEILTLFQALNLQDLLTFEFDHQDASSTKKAETNDVQIALLRKGDSIEEALFPLDKNNSIAQAIQTFLLALPDRPTVNIKVKIEKNIPIGAGLAGGSTDAAAALIALNHYFERPFTNDKLAELGAQIGSDVCFCLVGGLAIGRGRGEKLKKLSQHPKYHFVLVKPRSLSISTAWAYKTYDQFVKSANPTLISPHSIANVLLALEFESALDKHAKLFWNSFETVIFKEHPVLEEIKSHLLELGCLTAHLAGSGSTIYGLVRSEADGKRILKDIENLSLKNPIAVFDQRDSWLTLDTWLTQSIDVGAQVLSHELN